MRSAHLVSTATCALWIFLHAAALADEDYVHAFTGFTFPPRVGNFTRGDIRPYNAEHSDIQIDYRNRPYTCLISAYVYPASGGLREHYQKCRQEVMTYHPEAKLARESAPSYHKTGAVYAGLQADFTLHEPFGGRAAQDLRSRLILFRYGAYWVFYRITYTDDFAPVTEKQIDEFLQDFVWPAAPRPGT